MQICLKGKSLLNVQKSQHTCQGTRQFAWFWLADRFDAITLLAQRECLLSTQCSWNKSESLKSSKYTLVLYQKYLHIRLVILSTINPKSNALNCSVVKLVTSANSKFLPRMSYLLFLSETHLILEGNPSFVSFVRFCQQNRPSESIKTLSLLKNWNFPNLQGRFK